MWEARNRRSQARQLEARLRSARSTPRDEFVASVASRVSPRHAGKAWSRVAFAGALTALLVGMFASFGGVGYAASGATQAIHTLGKLTTTHKVKVHSAAASQYPGTPNAPTSHVAPAQKTEAAAVAVQSGSLPFTGFSLLATVLVSLTLMGIGLALRRREGRES